ncbi:MAG: TonB-dependent receptor [Lentisphaeraceae bacterium]|nr:TonB-dependent receptor [Lentisphaeraceae bacterium]
MKKPLLVFMLLIANQLNAQQKDPYSMSYEELSKTTITGSTLTEESLTTVPSAVTVFTHKELKLLGLDSLDELMNLVPGFQSYRTATTALSYPFSSRGRRIGFPAAEVLILVNGQRMEEPRTSGSETVLPKFPLQHIERVEFIRGAGSAVYGSNAMMGVVNIITRSGVNEFTVGYGSFNRRKASLLASQKTGDLIVDFFGQLEIDNGDDYRVMDSFSINHITTDDPRKLTVMDLKINWRDTHINILHNQNSTEKFYMFGRLSNGFNKNISQLSSISLKQDFNWQKLDSCLWLSYSHSYLEVASQLTAPGALAPISSPSSNDVLFANVKFDNYNETRLQWHNDWNIDELNSLQFGIELRYIDAPETLAKNNFDLGDLANKNYPVAYYGTLFESSITQSRSKREIMGLYAQFQRPLFEATRLTMGLRYDDFSNIGAQLSPRLGLVHNVTSQHSLKLLYGEAFRAPAENELYLRNNPVVLGNPDLKPEVVQSWELIWVGQWPHTGVSLGYFENHFKNSIVQTDIGANLRQYSNIDQAPVKGFEFEISHELNEHWLLRATYTHFNEKPDLSFREADQLASLIANYHRGKWNASLLATYHNEREIPAVGGNNKRISLDENWLLHGKLSYNFTPDYRAYIQVKNLLNEQYLTPVESAVLNNGIANRGREIFIGISWRF